MCAVGDDERETLLDNRAQSKDQIGYKEGERNDWNAFDLFLLYVSHRGSVPPSRSSSRTPHGKNRSSLPTNIAQVLPSRHRPLSRALMPVDHSRPTSTRQRRPGRKDVEEDKFDSSHTREIELKRSRGEISCAECRRCDHRTCSHLSTYSPKNRRLHPGFVPAIDSRCDIHLDAPLILHSPPIANTTQAVQGCQRN